MGYLGGFLVTLRQMGRGQNRTRPYVKDEGNKRDKPERLHGRHVLNRYEDGMEKCIGCELCAGVCPARCIYVRGEDNPADNPVSPGERYGFVYEINYLRCIHCDLCVEACPTEAITESKLFEFSFTNRSDAIYTKAELLVDDEGLPQQLPWEDWTDAEVVAPLTSAWMRATSPSGDARYEGKVAWSGELGFGVREPEEADLMVEALVFALSAVIILGGAVGVILFRNTVHAALSLVATLFGVAVLFVAQEANFLAAVQVIVYAGAIVVLFLFVIMLLGVDRTDDLDTEPLVGQRPIAIALGFLIAAGLVAVVATSTVTGVPSASEKWIRNGDDIAQIGKLLFTDYLFAFEITSLLLVIAVVGAVLLARTKAGRQVDADEPIALLPGEHYSDEVPIDDEVGAVIVATVGSSWYLSLGAVLFALGAVGVMVRRNPLVMFMCIELMLNAVNLTFVTFARELDDVGGQVVVFFVLVVAAAEVVVGLGIIVSILRRRPDATADDVSYLRG